MFANCASLLYVMHFLLNLIKVHDKVIQEQ